MSDRTDGSIIIDALLNIKNLKKDLGKFDSLISAGMKGATVAIGAITTGLTFASKQVLDFGTEYQKASNQLQAETGATAEEMERLNKIMEGTYANNFGESMEDVADAVALVNKQLGYFETDEEMQRATENALALRDTFEYDVSESVRSASTLMGTFAINSDEAFNLIAQGAQRGLDYSGELLDSVNEYSVQFNKLGLDAEDMFNIFESGTKAGAFNLDKIGDAVKEFSIRAIDGSNTTVEGFKKIGLNSDLMAKKFAQGGDVAKEAFYDVIKRIREMDNKVEQSIVGVDLFGTMWEDLGPDVITQLDSIRDAYDTTADTMEKINEIKYDDLGSALEGLKRNMQTNLLLPISKKILPAFNTLVNQFNKAFSSSKTQKSIEKISNAISKFALKAAETAEKWLPKLIDVLAWILEHGTGIAATILSISSAIKTIQKVNSVVKTIKSFTENLNKAKEVSASSNKVFSNMKGILGGVAGAVGIAVVAYQGYKAAQKYVSEQLDKIYEKTNQVTESVKQEVQARKDARNAIDEQTNSSLAEINNIESLKNELDTLVDKNGKVKQGYEARADFIVNQLNSALGTEIEVTNGVIKGYDKLSNSIDDMIAKKKAKIILDAKEEKYANAIKNQAKDYENYVKQQEAATEAQSRLNRLQAEYNSATDLAKASTWGLTMREAIEKGQKAVSDATATMNEAKAQYEQDLNDMTDYQTAYQLYQEGSQESIQQLYAMTATTHSNATTSMVDDLSNKLPNLLTQLEYYKQAYQETGESTSKTMVESTQKTIDAVVQSVVDSTTKTKELTPDLQDAWKKLAELSATDYENALSKISDDGTREAIKQIVSTTNSDTSVSKSAEELGQDYTKGVTTGVQNPNLLNVMGTTIKATGKGMVNWLKEALHINSPSKLTEQCGNYFLQGISNGVSNRGYLSNIYSKITSMAGEMLNKLKSTLGIHSPSKLTEQDGIYFVEGIINGLMAKEKKAYNAVSNLGYGLIDEFTNSFDDNSINSNIEALYSKMQSTIDFETSKLSSNLSTTATSNKDVSVSVNVNNGDVYLEKKKVGRILAPEISNVIKNGGIG